MISDDPTQTPGRWDELLKLICRIDTEIDRLYERLGHTEMRSRFAFPLLRIAHLGPLTIKELAHMSERTHSAMSQTVDAMKRAGLVQPRAGGDARTRLVELTEAGRKLVPLIKLEWQATEAAVAELDDTLTASLSPLADELKHALDTLSIEDRMKQHLERLRTEPRPWNTYSSMRPHFETAGHSLRCG